MLRFSRLDVYQRLLDEGLVPIFHHVDPDITCRVVPAIADGGGTVCEFTNRSPQAIEAGSHGARDRERRQATRGQGWRA